MVTQKLLNRFYKSGNNLFLHSVLRVSQPYFRGGTLEITISYPEEILHIKMFTNQKKSLITCGRKGGCLSPSVTIPNKHRPYATEHNLKYALTKTRHLVAQGN